VWLLYALSVPPFAIIHRFIHYVLTVISACGSSSRVR